MATRRDILRTGAAASIGLAVGEGAQAQPVVRPSTSTRQPEKNADGRTFPADPQERQRYVRDHDFQPGEPGRDYRPVVAPSMTKAPFRIVDGRKVFHLTASEFRHAFAEGLEAYCWGYNNQVNGPVIEAVEGDTVRIYVTNNLPAPTTVHWHGLILPHGMDGVSGLTQPPIPVGETWLYEFKLVQHGTFMYHSHHDTMTQEGMGLTGPLIIHPREPVGPVVDRDFVLMLHEWRIDVGAMRPNPNEMTDFNVLTMNGRVFPDIDPLVARAGQRVRIRLANLSAMDHHPIHLHGHEFLETAVDGYRIPEEQQVRKVTSLVAVGQTRDIEFEAIAGDWAMHCHMTHHIMNQMGHEFPNMIGVKASRFDARAKRLIPGYITMGTTGMKDMTDMDMAIPSNSIPMKRGTGPFGKSQISLGGMACILKVRDEIGDSELERNTDPGWFTQPDGSRVGRASRESMRRDGIAAE